jgi:hypothetical protein
MLIIGLVSLTLVILISSYQRLSLYESAYGFSRLRTYSHFFILWLGLLLISVVVFEVMNKPRIFANAVLAMVVGFVITLSFLNVDAFIVRRNIARADQGMELDSAYLASLSSDAIPRLAEEFNSSEHSSSAIRNEIGAALACQNNRLAIDESDPYNNSWPSFHFADWKARNALDGIQAELGRYRIQSDDYGSMVVDPHGVEFYCQSYMGID